MQIFVQILFIFPSSSVCSKCERELAKKKETPKNPNEDAAILTVQGLAAN